MNIREKLSVAVVGATGLVGTTLLKLLVERNFPVADLHVLASEHSVGKEIKIANKNYRVKCIEDFDFDLVDFSFFCVGNDLSKQFVPEALACNNYVIDKSYYYRNDPLVPLIVPEVNLSSLQNYQQQSLIANPNCTTIPLCVALKPIYDVVGIHRVNISTYQSVSGTGKEALQELTDQANSYINERPIEPKIYPHEIAFNVLPHIDQFQENGYTLEEMKMITEMRKIFSDETLAINPTAVRVPVFYGHALAVHLETKEKISAKAVTQLLRKQKGIVLDEDPKKYPTPKAIAGTDEVHVGRIREDISHPNGINLWIVADNLRKGAALNAIQIAEHLIKDNRL